MKRILAVFILLLTPALSWADISIAGNLAWPANKIVRLTAAGGTADCGYIWDVSSDTADLIEIGPKLLFTAPPGSYKVVLRSVNFKTRAIDTARATVTIGQVPPPVPPTPPVPPVPPVPPPGPAPIPAAGLHVLVIYESTDLGKMPPAQQAILYAQQVRDYLNAKCPVGKDGKKQEWRIWDQNVSTTGETPLWQEAFKRPHAFVPWVIVSNPDKGGGYEGPLPANIADMMTLLKKWGD